MDLFIAVGQREGFTDSGLPKLGKLSKPKRKVSWEKLAKRLSKFVETDDKGGHGFMVGGWFKGDRRLGADLVERQLVILDADYLESWDLDSIPAAYNDIQMVAHSTWSHTEDDPRMRIVIPLSRPVTEEEYEPVARKLAGWLGIDLVDSASFKWNQLMWMPAHQPGVEPVYYATTSGGFVDPDFILEEYDDWRDWGEWPQRASDSKAGSNARAAKNPYEAPGVIGAFNRVFTVTHAIEEFGLPYEPESDGADDRWGYNDRSGSCAARVYHNHGDACFLYSDHDTDPANGNNTAWDLVRIHKFGQLDKDYDGPIGKAPSQRAMMDYAMDHKAVIQEMAADEFDDVSVEVDGEQIPVEGLTFDNISNRIEDLGHDPNRGRDQYTKVVRKVAAAHLDDVDTETLLKNLKLTWPDPPPSLGALKNDVKRLQKKLVSTVADGSELNDIELELLRAVLDEWFAGGAHIRRFGRQFWVYEHGVWRREEDDQIGARLQDTFVRLRQERPEDQEAIVAAVGESKTSAITASLWTMFCRHVAGLNPGEDPMGLMKERDAIINCLNGELHFKRNGRATFEPHHPELFLVSQVPVNYDQSAKAPEWNRFCGLIFEDSLEPAEMQRHLEELGGYLIQYTRWLKTWVLFHGATNAGKTTIGKAFENLLGNAAANRPMSAFEGKNSHAEAGLVGKLMLLDEDFAKGGLLPDGFIKKVSEAKRITANPKNKDEFDFVCRSLPVVVANHWPPTRDVSDAFRERALVFDFPRGIPAAERDDERAERMLKDELPGILALFVRGFSRLRARGGWDVPADCIEARTEWETYTDSVACWASECVFEVGGQFLPRPGLYGLYIDWYRGHNPGGRALGQREFHDRFSKQYGAPLQRKGVRGWKGLEFRSSEFDD